MRVEILTFKILFVLGMTFLNFSAWSKDLIPQESLDLSTSGATIVTQPMVSHQGPEGGGEVGNGTGFYERLFYLAHEKLPSYICMVGQSLDSNGGFLGGEKLSHRQIRSIKKVCENFPEENRIFELNQQKQALGQNYESQIAFTTAEEQGDLTFFFKKEHEDGIAEEKVAITGNNIGDLIYLNRRLLKIQNDREPITLSFAFNKLFHEFAHHVVLDGSDRLSESEIEILSTKFELYTNVIEKSQFDSVFGPMWVSSYPSQNPAIPRIVLLHSKNDVIDISEKFHSMITLQVCNGSKSLKLAWESVGFYKPMDPSFYRYYRLNLMAQTPFIQVDFRVDCLDQIHHGRMFLTFGFEIRLGGESQGGGHLRESGQTIFHPDHCQAASTSWAPGEMRDCH